MDPILSPETLAAHYKAMEGILATANLQTQAIADAGKKSAEALAKIAEMQAATETRFKTFENFLSDMAQKAAGRRFSLQGGDDAVQVIPERERRHIRVAEMTCRSQEAEQSKTGRQIAPFVKDAPMKALAGLWLRGVRDKKANPGHYNPELQDKYFQILNGGTSEIEPGVKAALQEDTANEGGDFVPTIVQAEILRIAQDAGIARQAARTIVMTAKTHAFPAENATWTCNIIAEEGSITDVIPATPTAQRALTAKKFACFGTISNELIQDNVVAAMDWIALNFGEKIARKEDTELFEGDGTFFTGIVGASGVNSVSSGANGDRIFFAKIVETIFKAGDDATRIDGSLIMHPLTWAACLAGRGDSIVSGDLKGALLLAVNPGEMPRKFILGTPVLTTSGILTNRAVGTGTNRTNVYYAPRGALIVGDLMGMTIDLNPWSKFQTFQTDVRGVKRTGLLVGIGAACTKYTGIDNTLGMS